MKRNFKITLTTPPPVIVPNPPVKPTNLVVTSPNDYSIQLTFEDEYPNDYVYTLEYLAGEWITITDLTPEDTVLEVPWIEKTKTYQLRVKVSNPDGVVYSDTVSVAVGTTTTTVPPTITLPAYSGSKISIPSNTDAITKYAIDKLKPFADWCFEHKVHGYIGEVGWPKDDLNWNALASKWFAEANKAKLHVNVWSVGQWWWDYIMQPYQLANNQWQVTDMGEVVEQNNTTVDYIRGVNVNIAEFGADGLQDSTVFSNFNLGKVGTDYDYPKEDMFQFLKSRGINHIRLAIRWERIQPILNGALNQTELTLLTDTINLAGTYGIKTLINIHNFGRYHQGVAGNLKARNTIVFGGELTQTHFVNLWQRLSNEFKDNDNVYGYSLMNEPFQFTNNSDETGAKQWEYISNAVVTAIRANGDNKVITLAGYNWSHAHMWTTLHTRGPWVTDTNVMYEAHCYWDHWYEEYKKPYSQHNDNAKVLGFVDDSVPPIVIPPNTNNKITFAGDSLIGEPRTSRVQAYTRLKAANKQFSFVGTQFDQYTSIPDAFDYHEGYSGITIGGLKTKLLQTLPNLKPDVLVLQIGTNDLAWWYNGTVSNLVTDWINLLDSIRGILPNIHIFAYNLPVTDNTSVPPNNTPRNQLFNSFNAELKNRFVSTPKLTLLEHKVTLSDLRDAIHPTDAGYIKIANQFADAYLARY